MNWFRRINFIKEKLFFKKDQNCTNFHHIYSKNIFWQLLFLNCLEKFFFHMKSKRKKSQHCAFVLIIEKKPHNYERSYSEHSTFTAFEVPRWTVHSVTIVHAFVQWITHPNAPPSFFYRLEFLLDAISVKLPLKHLLCLFGLFVRYQPVRIGSCLCHTIYIGRLLLFQWVEAFA